MQKHCTNRESRPTRKSCNSKFNYVEKVLSSVSLVFETDYNDILAYRLKSRCSGRIWQSQITNMSNDN